VDDTEERWCGTNATGMAGKKNNQRSHQCKCFLMRCEGSKLYSKQENLWFIRDGPVQELLAVFEVAKHTYSKN